MPANRDIQAEAVADTEAVEAKINNSEVTDVKVSDAEAVATDRYERRPLIGLTPEQLSEVAVSVGLPRFAGKQMARWLYVARATSIDEMTDLSKQGRARLEQAGYIVGREEHLTATTSRDGTVKYLFRGCGGRDVEAVYIPEKDGRATLCVSSQAGCKMHCAFCMTGRQGFHGNLSTAQIINQILSIPQSRDLTNVVFMGMGEPTDNLEAVLAAIEILTAPWGLAWSPKRITVSTVGNIPGLRRLLDETSVHIAVSVHSADDEQRQTLMPVQKAYAIRDVMALLRDYDFAHQRRLSVEYILWDGVNDSPQSMRALARLLRGTDARVNIIPYHPIGGDSLRPSSRHVQESFRDGLNDLGITATIRASRGQDIMAACGMLAGAAKKQQPPYQDEK